MTLNDFIYLDPQKRFSSYDEFCWCVRQVWDRTHGGEVSCSLLDQNLKILDILLDWMDAEAEADLALPF